MLNWRQTTVYGALRPWVPNGLRSSAKRFRDWFSATFASRRILDFGMFALVVSNRESGGVAHESMYWHETSSPLERDIALQPPRLFLDIGANYGFSSLLHFSLNPDCAFIAVEANPILIPYIEHNLTAAGCSRFTVVNAIASSRIDAAATFAINRKYSQDSRVLGPPAWKQATLPAITIDQLTASVPDEDLVYLKVDTQGYEQHVLNGAQRFLSRSSAWILRVEFAPRWLQSQGTDPERFLSGLLRAYHVCEIPARAGFKTGTLDYLLRNPLLPSDGERFTAYIRHLEKGAAGYCDLLVLPKDSNLIAGDR